MFLSMIFDHLSMIFGYFFLGLCLIGGSIFGVQYLRYRRKFKNFQHCIGIWYLYIYLILGVSAFILLVTAFIEMITQDLILKNTFSVTFGYLVFVAMFLAILSGFSRVHFLKINKF